MRFYRNVVSRTLENGVRIFVFPQPGTAVEVECFVRTGSIHEGDRLDCSARSVLRLTAEQPGELAAALRHSGAAQPVLS